MVSALKLNELGRNVSIVAMILSVVAMFVKVLWFSCLSLGVATIGAIIVLEASRRINSI